mmetsp:Transcript_175232/g.562007  ORF Transcript_175232/g.562007 Transcript_175232/m.562007 type:complete len:87 (-) Transcript_175232:280-540(-)
MLGNLSELFGKYFFEPGEPLFLYLIALTTAQRLAPHSHALVFERLGTSRRNGGPWSPYSTMPLSSSLQDHRAACSGQGLGAISRQF